MFISIPVQWLALIFIELLTKRKSECRNLDLWVAKITWVYASGPPNDEGPEAMGRDAPWSEPQESK